MFINVLLLQMLFRSNKKVFRTTTFTT